MAAAALGIRGPQLYAGAMYAYDPSGLYQMYVPLHVPLWSVAWAHGVPPVPCHWPMPHPWTGAAHQPFEGTAPPGVEATAPAKATPTGDPIIDSHMRTDADGVTRFDFVLLPGTKNARPGMPLAGPLSRASRAPAPAPTDKRGAAPVASSEHHPTAAPAKSAPAAPVMCRYGKGCRSDHCRFRH